MEISGVFGIRQEPVTEGTAFLTSNAARLYGWWRSRAGDRLPLRREFDITEHAGIIGNIALCEMMPDGEFVMKIEGEAIIEMMGINSTGQIIRRTERLGTFGRAVAEYFDLIVAERACRRCTGNLERVNDRRWIEFETLDCPLSRDGRKVDFIISVISVVGPRRG
jgi:hypothetical protein